MAEFMLPAVDGRGAPSLLPRSATVQPQGGCRRPRGRSQGAIRAAAAEQPGKDFEMSFDRLGLDGDNERWMVVIQSSHMLFCDCGNFRKHLADLLGLKATPWPLPSVAGGDTAGGEGDTASHVDTSDAAMAAALDAVEGSAGDNTDG